MKRLVAYAALVASLLVTSTGYAAGAAPRADGLLDFLTPPEPTVDARFWSPDGTIGLGRQRHAYRYQVEAGESFWSLELFLLDPKGRRIASGFQAGGADPARGRGLFRFWSQGTRPGRYTIKAKLSWGDYDRAERWLEPRTFRLRRR